MFSWDLDLFYRVNRWPEAWAPFFRFLSEATDALWVRLALLAVLVALIRHRPTRRGALIAGLGWPLANAMTDVLKAAFPMPRPGNELSDAIVRVGIADSPGTASAHSANMMFVAVAFLLASGPWGIPWLVLAVLVGISRVYVGVHYPSQVLLGWLCGAVAAFVAVRTVEAGLRLVKTRGASSDREPAAGPSDRPPGSFPS